MKQIALGLRLPGQATFEDFWPGSNAEVLHHVERFARGGGEQAVFLWGGPGAGKTHLLYAVCNAMAEGRVGYLPLTEVGGHGPAVLEDLDNLECLCVDDVHAVAGRAPWERALFNCFNRVREHGHRLLIAAEAPPPGLPLAREDLASRFSSGLVCQLRGPTAEDLPAFVTHLCDRRGMKVTGSAIDYLLRRVARDVNAIVQLVDRLDTASLAAHRHVTLAFVRDWLAADGDAQL